MDGRRMSAVTWPSDLRHERLLDRTLDVVVDPGVGDLPGAAAFVHGDPRLVWQVDAAPPNGVELGGASHPVLGDCAVLENGARGRARAAAA